MSDVFLACTRMLNTSRQMGTVLRRLSCRTTWLRLEWRWRETRAVQLLWTCGVWASSCWRHSQESNSRTLSAHRSGRYHEAGQIHKTQRFSKLFNVAVVSWYSVMCFTIFRITVLPLLIISLPATVWHALPFLSITSETLSKGKLHLLHSQRDCIMA